jgi:hypothetical protein
MPRRMFSSAYLRCYHNDEDLPRSSDVHVWSETSQSHVWTVARIRAIGQSVAWYRTLKAETFVSRYFILGCKKGSDYLHAIDFAFQYGTGSFNPFG